MLSYDELPIILVSAANEDAADKIISDIIDNDVTDEVSHNETTGTVVVDRVWRIINKYYSADVRLHAVTYQQQNGYKQTLSDNIEAHIVYLAEDQIESVENERWTQLVMDVGKRAQVRVLAVECGATQPPEHLVAAALQLRLELISMHGDDDDDHYGDVSVDEYGARRIRDALHAHTWRGLQYVHLTSSTTQQHFHNRKEGSALQSSSSCSGDSDDEYDAVEHAEWFASAVEVLRDAGTQCTMLNTSTDPTDRIRRADILLDAFYTALGRHDTTDQYLL